jgi:hypothetical protein
LVVTMVATVRMEGTVVMAAVVDIDQSASVGDS